MPQQSRTSGAAIASLICGLLFCIPFVTGLVAAILGLIGLSSTKNPNIRGRGMAIAGLILGLLSLLVWTTSGMRIANWLRNTTAERAFAKTYVTDLMAGNIDADVSRSTATVTSDVLQAAQQQAQPWGALQSTIIVAMPTQKNGSYICAVVVVCNFAGGQHQCQMELVKDSNGNFLVNKFDWTK